MGLEKLSSLHSLISSLLSLSVFILFLIIIEKQSTHLYLIKNSRKISFALISATLLLVPFLSLFIDNVLFSKRIFEEFILKLLSALLILFLFYLLFKMLIKPNKIIDLASPGRELNIREISIRQNIIARHNLKIKLTKGEASALINGFNDKSLFLMIDKHQFANIIRTLMLAQNDEEIPLEIFLYAVETIISSRISSVELPGQLFSILCKYSSKIEKDYFLNLKEMILRVISSNFLQMETDSAQRIIHELENQNITLCVEIEPSSGSTDFSSQEDYERSKEFSYFFYDQRTKAKYKIDTYEPASDKTVAIVINSAMFMVKSLEQLFENVDNSVQF